MTVFSEDIEMKTGSFTSSAGLDEKHLRLVLEQRTVWIVKSLKHPVQLKLTERHTFWLVNGITYIDTWKEPKHLTCTLTKHTCSCCPSVPYIAPSTPWDSRHTTQLSTVRWSGRSQKFSMHVFMPCTNQWIGITAVNDEHVVKAFRVVARKQWKVWQGDHVRPHFHCSEWAK